MRSSHLLLGMSVFVAGVFVYAALAPKHVDQPDAAGVASGVSAPRNPSASAPPAVYDVAPLVQPAWNYLGTAISGAPQDMSRIEPFKQRFTDIAAGRFDDYLREFATDVRKLNLPIALTVAHEFNGHWYPWGTQRTRAKDFVAGWRHIHDVFAQVGATNVIWTWTPNVVNYLGRIPLRQYWPGASYVNWVGIDGYFTHKGEQTFESLFRPTLNEVKKFTGKPVLIVETGAEPGSMRAKAVTELFSKVAKDPNIVGFVYFNSRGSGNWVIDHDQRALKVFRTHRHRGAFVFTVK